VAVNIIGVKMSNKVKYSELRLRDVVDLESGDYSIATVVQITEDRGIKFFRPYVMTSDFSYTGGVIPYIGFEEFHTPVYKDKEITLVRREREAR